jgi:hypothetical protein
VAEVEGLEREGDDGGEAPREPDEDTGGDVGARYERGVEEARLVALHVPGGEGAKVVMLPESFDERAT